MAALPAVSKVVAAFNRVRAKNSAWRPEELASFVRQQPVQSNEEATVYIVGSSVGTRNFEDPTSDCPVVMGFTSALLARVIRDCRTAYFPIEVHVERLDPARSMLGVHRKTQTSITRTGSGPEEQCTVPPFYSHFFTRVKFIAKASAPCLIKSTTNWAKAGKECS